MDGKFPFILLRQNKGGSLDKRKSVLMIILAVLCALMIVTLIDSRDQPRPVVNNTNDAVSGAFNDIGGELREVLSKINDAVYKR